MNWWDLKYTSNVIIFAIKWKSAVFFLHYITNWYSKISNIGSMMLLYWIWFCHDKKNAKNSYLYKATMELALPLRQLHRSTNGGHVTEETATQCWRGCRDGNTSSVASKSNFWIWKGIYFTFLWQIFILQTRPDLQKAYDILKQVLKNANCNAIHEVLRAGS